MKVEWRPTIHNGIYISFNLNIAFVIHAEIISTFIIFLSIPAIFFMSFLQITLIQQLSYIATNHILLRLVVFLIYFDSATLAAVTIACTFSATAACSFMQFSVNEQLQFVKVYRTISQNFQHFCFYVLSQFIFLFILIFYWLICRLFYF